MKTSESVKALLPALAKYRKALKPLEKDAENPHFNSTYVSLDSIIEEVTPILAAEGLSMQESIAYHVGDSGPLLVVVGRIYHDATGEWVEAEMPFVLPADPQKVGGCVTYGRRYVRSALGGLSAQDDDGETASGRPQTGAGKTASAPSAYRKSWDEMSEQERTDAFLSKLRRTLTKLTGSDRAELDAWFAAGPHPYKEVASQAKLMRELSLKLGI